MYVCVRQKYVYIIAEKYSALFCLVSFVFTIFVVAIADMTVHFDEDSERYEPSIIVAFKAAFITLGRLGNFIANGVSLLFLRERNSTAALFLCENRSGLRNLVNMYAFGKLPSTLEDIFTNLLVTDDPQVTVHIKKVVWELSDYCRCFMYFSPFPNREFIADGS